MNIHSGLKYKFDAYREKLDWVPCFYVEYFTVYTKLAEMAF